MNGVVIAVTSNDFYAFHPMAVFSEVSLFGRYHWQQDKTIKLKTVFDGFVEDGLHLSLSRNYFALLSFEDRLAVFDVSFKKNELL